jgi:DNA invertase Pin-like site-specific DNA recombinase
MEQPKQKVIAYTRRSQDKRGQKHSINRQIEEIEQFAKTNDLIVVEWFSETASGMKDDRAELSKAIKMAERSGSAIIVSSVSRLGRKLSKLAEIIENPNVSIICADIGMTANFLQVCIMSIFAAEERNLLSKRTKQGIRAARNKAIAEGKDFKIGNPVWDKEHCLPSAWEANRRRGAATAIRLGGLIRNLRTHTGMSFASIARELNSINYPTPSGTGKWYSASVNSIYSRFMKENNDDRREKDITSTVS